MYLHALHLAFWAGCLLHDIKCNNVCGLLVPVELLLLHWSHNIASNVSVGSHNWLAIQEGSVAHDTIDRDSGVSSTILVRPSMGCTEQYTTHTNLLAPCLLHVTHVLAIPPLVPGIEEADKGFYNTIS